MRFSIKIFSAAFIYSLTGQFEIKFTLLLSTGSFVYENWFEIFRLSHVKSWSATMYDHEELDDMFVEKLKKEDRDICKSHITETSYAGDILKFGTAISIASGAEPLPINEQCIESENNSLAEYDDIKDDEVKSKSSSDLIYTGYSAKSGFKTESKHTIDDAKKFSGIFFNKKPGKDEGVIVHVISIDFPNETRKSCIEEELTESFEATKRTKKSLFILCNLKQEDYFKAISLFKDCRYIIMFFSTHGAKDYIKFVDGQVVQLERFIKDIESTLENADILNYFFCCQHIAGKSFSYKKSYSETMKRDEKYPFCVFVSNVGSKVYRHRISKVNVYVVKGFLQLAEDLPAWSEVKKSDIEALKTELKMLSGPYIQISNKKKILLNTGSSYRIISDKDVFIKYDKFTLTLKNKSDSVVKVRKKLLNKNKKRKVFNGDSISIDQKIITVHFLFEESIIRSMKSGDLDPTPLLNLNERFRYFFRNLFKKLIN
ncbi:DgyrCDS5537 [Dimorphilus gyrociliatus]|uniref:DgyrCDS5537 n=1 Tax=Dimorphilus gyrociliatus TaxID=2664684 RepID=A0A7I8VPZ8_9ANNE|nr:DgyrCDS5537 [Dimorphilus gyrociliatus]